MRVLGAARRCGWILGVGSVASFWPDFRIFGGRGRLEGLDGVSPLAPVHRLAEGLGGWLALLASFFVVLLF